MRYGPVAWIVATAARNGVSWAYAPALSRHRTSRASSAPSAPIALRMCTTESSRGLAARSSSARDDTNFTGRPDLRASRQAQCSNVTSSLPPKPPPTVAPMTLTAGSGTARILARVARTPKGFWVLVRTV